jgi:hypothetical protein
MPAAPTERSWRGAAAALVVLVAAAAAAYYVWRWEPRSHVPSDVAYWYRVQFKPGQIRPGWNLLSVGRDAAHPELLVHHVLVPGAVAGDLVMMGTSERNRLVAEIACPQRDHPIWTKLRRRHDVRIALQSERGEFAGVGCRAEVF